MLCRSLGRARTPSSHFLPPHPPAGQPCRHSSAFALRWDPRKPSLDLVSGPLGWHVVGRGQAEDGCGRKPLSSTCRSPGGQSKRHGMGSGSGSSNARVCWCVWVFWGFFAASSRPPGTLLHRKNEPRSCTPVSGQGQLQAGDVPMLGHIPACRKRQCLAGRAPWSAPGSFISATFSGCFRCSSG